MSIILSEKMKKYMQEKSLSNIVVDVVKKSCWTGSFTDITARFADTNEEKKLFEDDFESYDTELGKVFFAPEVQVIAPTVNFELSKVFWKEMITVEGVRPVNF